MSICNKWAGWLLVAGAAFAAPKLTGPQLASPLRHYSIKLSPLYSPQMPAMGLHLKARIDGGPAMRLLLDSGATYLTLSKRAASLSGHSTGTGFEVVGAGSTPRMARMASPGAITIGDLLLRDCPILIVDSKLPDGIDGVIPLALFAAFLVHLDLPGRLLELEPYPGPAPAQDGDSPARVENGLLYLPAVVNETRSGYVLLDTGATYNAVPEQAARAWNVSRISSPGIGLRGGAGESHGFLLPNPVRFRFGSHVISAYPVVAVDISELARRQSFEIAGVLGYAGLRESVITVDYRNSSVRILSK